MNTTAYDAVYPASAERPDVPLPTCDTKLDKVNGHRVTVARFERS